jgi:hypothetical protein
MAGRDALIKYREKVSILVVSSEQYSIEHYQYFSESEVAAGGAFFDLENARDWVIREKFLRFWSQIKQQLTPARPQRASQPTSSPIFAGSLGSLSPVWREVDPTGGHVSSPPSSPSLNRKRKRVTEHLIDENDLEFLE